MRSQGATLIEPDVQITRIGLRKPQLSAILIGGGHWPCRKYLATGPDVPQADMKNPAG